MTRAGEHTSTRSERLSQTVLTAFGTTRPMLLSRSDVFLQWGRRVWSIGRNRVARAAGVVGAVTTPAGWAVVLIAVIADVFGFRFGWVEVAALGLTASALVVVCALFLIGQNVVDVELRVSEPRTVVGCPLQAEVRVAGGRRGIGWSPRIEVRLGDEIIHVTMGGLRTDARSAAFPIPAERRGVVPVGPVRTVRGDPLGLFRRSVEWTSVVQVHVHPRTVAIPRTSTGLLRDLDGGATRDLTADDLAFHALREYRPGDDLRHIHWKSTARTGALTVRQFEESRRSHVAVAFGGSAEDCADAEEFELVIATAASIALRAIRDGGDITVLTSPAGEHDAHGTGSRTTSPRARAIRTHSPDRLLDDVSSLRFGGSEVSLGQLAALAARDVTGVSLVYLVCGSTPSARELRSWSRRFPLGVETVAVVCITGHVPRLFRVQELSVLTIGFLDDLRLALVNGRAT